MMQMNLSMTQKLTQTQRTDLWLPRRKGGGEEDWKFGVSRCGSESRSVISDSLWPHGLYSLPGSSANGILQPEYWSGWPFPSPGDLPNSGIEPSFPHFRWILYCLSHKGSPSRCKLLYVEWINRVLLYSPENYIQYSMIKHNGKEYEKECIYMYNWITLLYSRN